MTTYEINLPTLTLPVLSGVSEKQIAFATDVRGKFFAAMDDSLAKYAAETKAESDEWLADGDTEEVEKLASRWEKRLDQFSTARAFLSSIDDSSWWLDNSHDPETLVKRLYSRVVDTTLYGEALTAWRAASGQ